MYFLTDGERLDGAIIFHISAAIYFFILLAVVCHDYFLPSVECICEDWNISKVFFNSLLACFYQMKFNQMQIEITIGHYFLCTGRGSRFFYVLCNNCTGIFHEHYIIVCN